MSEPGGPDAIEPDAESQTRRTVRSHESRPGRIVFTEAGNTDGWIATDVVVDPEP